MAKAKVATAKDIEFSRWCVEMALKWPTITTYSGGQAGVYSGGGGLGQQQVDADVIGRATKIAAWVKTVR